MTLNGRNIRTVIIFNRSSSPGNLFAKCQKRLSTKKKKKKALSGGLRDSSK